MLGSDGDSAVVGINGAGAVVLAGIADRSVDKLAAASAEDDDEVGLLGTDDGKEAPPIGECGLNVFLSDEIGLRVVGRRSQRVRLPVGLLRAIGCVLFPVGLLWVVIDRQRRSLQDIVFRTRVVYSRPVAG